MIKNNDSLITQLEQAFCVLPGVGHKSASRMAHHLLQRALKEVGHCQLCQTLTEHKICELCQSPTRNPELLCVVASPLDVQLIEQSSVFNGRYFVLKGLLSPLDGVGPNELLMDCLFHRLQEEHISEVILALSPTVEGEATIHYITKNLKNQNIKVTRLAYGVPVGGELEYLNANTISQALSSRSECMA